MQPEFSVEATLILGNKNSYTTEKFFDAGNNNVTAMLLKNEVKLLTALLTTVLLPNTGYFITCTEGDKVQLRKADI